MPTSDEERERQRIARLREGQISSRDPGASKIRHYDWSKQKARKRTPILDEIFGVFPPRIKGLMLGIVVALIIQYLAPDVGIIGLVLLPVFMIAGFVLGASVQQ